MAPRGADLETATVAAERLVTELGLSTLPIDPIALARDRGIQVQGAHLEGASGMLAVVGNQFAILYTTSVSNPGFHRFSVAHELGHYFLPGHHELLFDGAQFHHSHAGFESQSRLELEADHFAAGLLMPRPLFRAALAREPEEGLEAILALSERCGTSRTAAAIRYAQCSDEPVAVIVSRKGAVDYCFLSEPLAERTELDWLRKHEPIPGGTLTSSFHKRPAKIANGDRDQASVDLRTWFGGKREIEVAEEVVGLGAYEKCLTIIKDIDLDSADEDEELEDAWTPRFRR